MTEQAQSGHEHVTERAYVMELSTPFVDSLSSEQLESFVAALASTFESTQGAAVDEIADVLRERLDATGVARPEGHDEQAAEHFAGASELVIVTDRGQTLSGRDPKQQQPDVVSSEDPESGERPFFS